MKPIGLVLPNGKFAARITSSHAVNQDLKIFMKPSLKDDVTSDEAQQWVDQQIADWRLKPNMLVPLGMQVQVNTIGSDPEMFVVSTTTGKVIPAFKFLPKEGAVEDQFGGRKTQVFWDGFQAEFTTQPASCLAYLVDYFQTGLKNIYHKALSFDPNAKMSYSCLEEIDQETIDNASDEHVALGCSPSINIYDIPKIMVGNPRELTRRVAGCHVHLGLLYDNQQRAINCVKMVDKTILLMSMGMLEGLEDTSRREYYGRPGEIRFPGVKRIEYRALPSTVQIHPSLVHFHFDMTRLVFDLEDTILDWLWDGTEEEMIEVVMSGDITRAREILVRNEKLAKYLIQRKYYHPQVVNKSWQMIMEGAKKFLPSLSIEDNWCLKSSWAGHSNDNKGSYAVFARALA